MNVLLFHIDTFVLLQSPTLANKKKNSCMKINEYIFLQHPNSQIHRFIDAHKISPLRYRLIKTDTLHARILTFSLVNIYAQTKIILFTRKDLISSV